MSTAITSFTKYVESDLLPCPKPIIEREISNTIIEFCEKTRLLTKVFLIELDKETVPLTRDYTITTTTQDSVDISLSSLFTGVRIVAVDSLNLDGQDKTPKHIEIVNTIPDEVWDAMVGENDLGYFIKSNTEIRFYDVETSDSELSIGLVVAPTRAATTVDDILFERWLEAIAAGTRWKVLSMPGKEWTDKNTAAENYIEFRRGISRARMLRLKEFSTKAQTVNPRPFDRIEG
jgi:hypothetical protein